MLAGVKCRKVLELFVVCDCASPSGNCVFKGILGMFSMSLTRWFEGSVLNSFAAPMSEDGKHDGDVDYVLTDGVLSLVVPNVAAAAVWICFGSPGPALSLVSCYGMKSENLGNPVSSDV